MKLYSADFGGEHKKVKEQKINKGLLGKRESGSRK